MIFFNASVSRATTPIGLDRLKSIWLDRIKLDRIKDEEGYANKFAQGLDIKRQFLTRELSSCKTAT
jgi:hypothetical protein